MGEGFLEGLEWHMAWRSGNSTTVGDRQNVALVRCKRFIWHPNFESLSLKLLQIHIYIRR